MNRLYRFAAVASVLAALTMAAACSGGGNSGGGIPPTAPTGAASSRATVTFTIAIPKQTSSTTRPAYVSPATQSMTIKVLQGSTSVVSQTVGLTASSTGCTSSLANLTCTLQLTLNPGSYTASITTYDGASGTGNALSTAQAVAFTVTAGENNLVPLSLSGIPASVVVTSASQYAVDVVAKDADGNYIVGSGAPTYTGTGSGSSVVTINQPTASQPNVISFSVPSPAPSPGVETITITAGFPSGQTNGCSQSGATCTASTTITATYEGTLWVPNHHGTTILGFSLPLTGAETPAYSISVPSEPEAIAVDANGDLFSDNENGSGNGTFEEFASPSFGITASNAAGGTSNFNMVAAPNGDIGVGGSGAFLVFQPPYTGMPVTLQNGGSNAVAVDANDTFYGGWSNYTVTSYPAPYSGAGATVTLASGSGSINGMLVSGNTLFVSQDSAINVFTLPLTASSTPVTIPVASSTAIHLYGLAVDSHGDLWVAANEGGANTSPDANGDGALLEYKAPFSSSEAPSVDLNAPFGSDTSYNPYGIVIDGNNTVYVCMQSGGSNSGAIIDFVPPYSGTSVVVDTSSLNNLTNLTLSAPKLVITL